MILSPWDLIVDYGRMGMVEEIEGLTLESMKAF
jgi:hypothetical protein